MANGYDEEISDGHLGLPLDRLSSFSLGSSALSEQSLPTIDSLGELFRRPVPFLNAGDERTSTEVILRGTREHVIETKSKRCSGDAHPFVVYAS